VKKIKITIELTEDQYNAMLWHLADITENDNITRQDVIEELKHFANFETYRANNPSIEFYLND
jgi:hypothetical protein